MKKIIGMLVLISILFVSFNVSAAYEECTQFDYADSNWGTVYVTSRYGSNGGYYFAKGNVDINPLPYGMIDLGYIYKFSCYNGRIYYMTGPEGSYITEPVSIYSCDMNGNDNVLIANNVSAWSEAFIVDNVLYYEGFYSIPGDGVQGYYGGIYRVNLGDCTWKKIVDGRAELEYCDGDYVYFKTYVTNPYNFKNTYSYFAVDVNGYSCISMPEDCDEFSDNLFTRIRGNKTYYISNNALYEKTRNSGNVKKICDVPKSTFIHSVTSSYIYYTILSEYPNAKLYRVNR